MATTTTTTVVEVPLTSDVLREIDAGASEQRQSRAEILSELARQYASERRWQRIRQEGSRRAREAGLFTEDDVEAFMDALDDEPPAR
jgi:metal-responsive CopG/Arc/MetJ family transcriptional regulator